MQYNIGDRIGVCGNCMAEFIIEEILENSYKTKCVEVCVDDDFIDQADFKLNETYIFRDTDIVIKLN
jgi:hypothetical protein